jgi:hypothetical protein
VKSFLLFTFATLCFGQEYVVQYTKAPDRYNSDKQLYRIIFILAVLIGFAILHSRNYPHQYLETNRVKGALLWYEIIVILSAYIDCQNSGVGSSAILAASIIMFVAVPCYIAFTTVVLPLRNQQAWNLPAQEEDKLTEAVVKEENKLSAAPLTEAVEEEKLSAAPAEAKPKAPLNPVRAPQSKVDLNALLANLPLITFEKNKEGDVSAVFKPASYRTLDVIVETLEKYPALRINLQVRAQHSYHIIVCAIDELDRKRGHQY